MFFIGAFGYEDRNLVLTAMGFFYYDCQEVFVPDPIDPFTESEVAPLIEPIIVVEEQEEPSSNLTYLLVLSVLTALAIPIVAFSVLAHKQNKRRRAELARLGGWMGGKLNKINQDPTYDGTYAGMGNEIV